MHSKILFIKPELKLSNKIAVVGSSNNLSTDNYASEIDSHDEVVRFNRAPILGYEHIVGSKTTLRVVNNHVFENKEEIRGYTNQPKDFIKELRGQRILLYSGSKRPWKQRYKNSHISNKLHKFNYAKLHEIKRCLNFSSDSILTTCALFIGLCVISKVKPTIFGFDTTLVPRTHYFESRPSDIDSPVHKIPQEIESILQLEKKGLVVIK